MYGTTQFGQFPQQEYWNDEYGNPAFLRMRQPGEDFNPFAQQSNQPSQNAPQSFTVNPMPPAAAPVQVSPLPPAQAPQNALLPAWLPQNFRDRAARLGMEGQPQPIPRPLGQFGQFPDQANYMQPMPSAQMFNSPFVNRRQPHPTQSAQFGQFPNQNPSSSMDFYIKPYRV